MRILVTGGAGYVGSVVAQELLSSGHQVTVYDNLCHGHRAAVRSPAELIVGDINDKELLEQTFARNSFDAVMHFAAFIEAGESMQVPEKYFRNNASNALTLLEAMLCTGVRKIVFSSTAALYGEPERVPIREDDRLKPTNVYGESKLMVEQMLAWFNRLHGLRYASLRYFNAAGAAGELGEAHEPESHLIPLVLQTALGKRESISIYGNDYPTEDGTCVRDYIHVSDLAAAHVLALAALNTQAKLIYNLGNGTGFSVRRVVDVARAVTGRQIKAVDAPRRPGDPAILLASSDKIRRELGWAPRHPKLEQIISSAWEWHREHPDGYAATAKLGQ